MCGRHGQFAIQHIYVKCEIWVCISSEYPEGSGYGGVAICAWALVTVVKASGDRMAKGIVKVEELGCQRVGVSQVVLNVGWWLPGMECEK